MTAPAVPLAASDPLLLDMLDGLVPLHLARIADLGPHRAVVDTVEVSLGHLAAEMRGRAAADLDGIRLLPPADGLAWVLAMAGDRLIAPDEHPKSRRVRGCVLSAAALTLALGARQPDGVTWGGRHWCTTPHPGCPNRMEET